MKDIQINVPSSNKILSFTGNSNENSSAILGTWLVGNFSMDLTVFNFVAIKINIYNKVIDTFQFNAAINRNEAFRCY